MCYEKNIINCYFTLQKERNDMKLKKCLGYFCKQKTDSSCANRKRSVEGSVNEMIEHIDRFLSCYNAIANSKAIRALPWKTQVFALPTSYIVRNRYSHTLEVVSIATQIAYILGLNVRLVEAIALGHDIGHLPFGHLGEKIFSDFTKKNMHHRILGTIILDKVERGGVGLNLSKQVLEGIYYHSAGADEVKGKKGFPLEYLVVLFADKIAYLFADSNDATRVNDMPSKEMNDLINFFGKTQRQRVQKCIEALLLESCEKDYVDLYDSEVGRKFQELKKILYQEVYHVVDREESKQRLWDILTYLKQNEDLLCIKYDLFFSLMTDNDCMSLYNAINNNESIKDCLAKFSAMEIAKRLKKNNIYELDLTVPALF